MTSEEREQLGRLVYEAAADACVRAYGAGSQSRRPWVAAREADREVGRLIADVVAGPMLERIVAAERDLMVYEAMLAMAVDRLGGAVDGLPTGRANFLRRIDELREIERRAEGGGS